MCSLVRVPLEPVRSAEPPISSGSDRHDALQRHLRPHARRALLLVGREGGLRLGDGCGDGGKPRCARRLARVPQRRRRFQQRGPSRPRAPWRRADRQRARRKGSAGHLERRIGPVQLLARALDLLLAQRLAVGGGLAGLGRRAVADRRLARDQPRLGAIGARLGERLRDRLGVLAVDRDRVPAARLEAHRLGRRRPRGSSGRRSRWSCRRTAR